VQNLPRWGNFDGGQALLCHLSYILDARCYHDFFQDVPCIYFIPFPGSSSFIRLRRRSLWNLRNTHRHRHPNSSQAGAKKHTGHTKRSANMVYVKFLAEALVVANGNRSLYIQALIAMQQTRENELLSWFQVAGRSSSLSNATVELTGLPGIHGRPFISWDKIEWNPSAPEVGYCPHSSTLFTTVRAFESFLYKHNHYPCQLCVFTP
jgi:hypothetical protein